MAKLYRILNDLSGNTKKKVLPDGMNYIDLSSAFLDFFQELINLTKHFVDRPLWVDTQVLSIS